MLGLIVATVGFGLKNAYACSCLDFFGEKSEIVLEKITLSHEGTTISEIPKEFASQVDRFRMLNTMSARGGKKPYLFIA
jgi:hypothetical protein